MEFTYQDNGTGSRRMVDIFSHFSRLISDGQADDYMHTFEQNNLLANIGPEDASCNGPKSAMKSNMTSLPMTGRRDNSSQLIETSATLNRRLIPDRPELTDLSPAEVSRGSPHGFAGFTPEVGAAPDVKVDVKKKGAFTRPPMLPPCRVCGDTASGFHYGVNTCEACKGFFRRSILKSTPHACVSSGNCKLLRGRRTSCSACRFKRCVEVGMSKDAIKTGRYTHELRSKNILEVKRLQRQTSGEGEKQASNDPEQRTPDVGGVMAIGRRCEETMRAVDGVNQWTESDETGGQDRQTVENDLVLEQLMVGQTFLHEFLDEYFDDDLMLKRQREIHERYLKDKKRWEIWDKIRARNEHSAPSQDYKQPEHTSSKKYLNTINVGGGGDISGRSSVTERNAQCSDDSSQGSGTGIRCLNSSDINSPGDSRNEISLSESCSSIGGLSGNESSRDGHLNRISQCLSGNYSDSQRSISGNNVDVTISGNSVDIPRDYSVGVTGVSKSVSSDGEDELHPDLLQDPMEELEVKVLSNFLDDMKPNVAGMLAFSKSIPGFSDLSNQDQIALIQASKLDIWAIGHIRCFNSELQVGACEWRFHADELSKVWGEDLVAMTFNLMRVGRDLDLNKEETAVLRALAISFSDRCFPLQDRNAVEEIHDHMLNVLKSTVQKRTRNFNKWFARVVRLLTNLREINTVYEQKSSDFVIEWTAVKDNPTLLEVYMS